MVVTLPMRIKYLIGLNSFCVETIIVFGFVID